MYTPVSCRCPSVSLIGSRTKEESRKEKGAEISSLMPRRQGKTNLCFARRQFVIVLEVGPIRD